MLGRYRLEALLGQGGMAEVYRATDTKLARTVAVKVILPAHARDPHFVERFLREARLVASLEHPNILPVYDFGEEADGSVWLVMPYVDGGTLRDRMGGGGPVPLATATAWIRQLADALDAAHAAGVLHRDVKPANVLVARGERLVLADFGIAKMLEAGTGLTATGVVVGTPVYMAPEQAQGRPATAATDRYALAVLAYELLSGRPPFDGESALALMHQHVTTPAPALSTMVPGLPAGLDPVLRKALSKEPSERHPTCRALAEEIAAFAPAGAARDAPSAKAPSGESAATVLRATRPPSVAVETPPPSITSAATVAWQGGGARSRALALAGIGAALALGAMFVWSRTRTEPPPTPAQRNEAHAVAPTAPADPVSAAPVPPDAVSVVEKPGAAPRGDAAPPSTAATARPAAASAAPPTALAEDEAEVTAQSVKPLAEAHRRLDLARDGRRPTREDFAFAREAARKALAENPGKQEARSLLAYAQAGLAYLDGNEADAKAALASALSQGRRLGTVDARRLWLLQRGEEGAGEGWALAIALGDPKRSARPLLDRAIAESPSDARPLLARSVVDRLDGRRDEAVADARAAYDRAARPAMRSAAAEIAGEELARAGRHDEALSWLRRALAEAPAEARGKLAMRAARLTREKLADEEAAREFLRAACRSGSEPACREVGMEPERRARPRLLRRLRGGA